MEKSHKATKAIKKEKPNQPILSESTTAGSTTLKKKTGKQGSNKDRNSPHIKNAAKDGTISKSIKSERYNLQINPNATKPINKTSENEATQNIRRPKNIPPKAELKGKKASTSSTVQKRTKPNTVLDTFQNVTVSSPPMPRKNLSETKELSAEATESTSNSKRNRTNTRTLQPEEVIVLRNESAKKRIESEIQAVNKPDYKNSGKEPVAFEISFEKDANKSKQTTEEGTFSDNEINYSDDFESYESDFESEPNSAATFSNEEKSDQIQGITLDHTEFSDSQSKTSDVEPDEEESEITQNPITVIQRDKFLDKHFDSGHYDMISRIPDIGNEGVFTTHQQTFDSLDTFSGTVSEQLDSGISSCRAIIKTIDEIGSISYGGYSHFFSRPVLTTRGSELISKIKFDTLMFSLFELKPISYDTFMQTYGKLNTTQSFAQSKENFSTSDSQTDECEMRSKWTQHPPKFDLETLQKQKVYLSSQNCCGQSMENFTDPALEDDVTSFIFKKLVDPSGLHCARTMNSIPGKLTDFSHLQAFLGKASNLMLKVLSITHAESRIEKLQVNSVQNSRTGLSMGYNQLNTKFLSALRVVHIFANSKHNLVITVLESLPEADVYRCDFSNLLMVWSTNDSTKPMRLLSTWSKACRVEICNDMPDIIVCGLSDGSVAMWDLRETYSFCSKLDGHLTHFAATQSIAPIWNGSSTGGKTSDLGAIIDIKSFASRRKIESISTSNNNYKTVQFTSLNDSGVIVIWTLVEVMKSDSPLNTSKENTKLRNSDKKNDRIEYSSPWARVKLVQSAIFDLRSYLELELLKAPSNFERAKLLFEKNIYSDDILREINKITSLNGNNKLQGLRFACIAVGYETIYVCTNRNFILICSKTLKPNKFRKVFIDESRFLFPTALKLLTNDDFLAVGLSNGSVMVLNCNQKYRNHKSKKSDEILNSRNTPLTPLPKQTVDLELETGKSCAIQNIILNERNSFEQYCNEDNTKLYQRPKTTASIHSLTTKQKPFEQRMLDQQLLLSGCMQRKHLVQSLELSSDGWLLFALSNGEIRCYDFHKDREATSEELISFKTTNSKVINMAVAQTTITQQHLILLTNENVVQMHTLMQ